MADPILKLVPTMQSLALLSHNVKHIKKKRKKTGDIIGLGIDNIIGVTLTKETADFIGD